jgi:Protein of unknown function (DUF2905)
MTKGLSSTLQRKERKSVGCVATPQIVTFESGKGFAAMTDFGKLLIVLGIVLVIAGVFLIVVGRAHLPLGRLPGDIVYRGKNTTFYFPLGTSILLSVILTLVLYVVNRWRR